MNRWALVTNGVCVTVVESAAAPTVNLGGAWVAVDASIGPGWQYDGTTWALPVVRVSLPVREFLRLFTPAERDALEDIAATGTAAQRKKLNAFRFYIQTGGNVELADDYIIASVTAMETAGVLGAGRAAQILGV
jgi:hypothetical protein